MPIIQKGNNCLFLNIPQQITKLKQWHKGTELIFVACENGDIKLKEMPMKK